MNSIGIREDGNRRSKKHTLTRGELLRQLGERNNSTGTEAEATVINSQVDDSASFVKESVLGTKAKTAANLLVRMGDPKQDTDDLIDNLAALKNVIVAEMDDLVLAGYAEACVSILLKHLDSVGISKASLEDVVTCRLLLDVPNIAKLYRS